MKRPTILTTINAFTAVTGLPSMKVPGRSGISPAGSFFPPIRIFRLIGEWFALVFGHVMNDRLYREILRSGSKIRMIAEASLHPGSR